RRHRPIHQCVFALSNRIKKSIMVGKLKRVSGKFQAFRTLFFLYNKWASFDFASLFLRHPEKVPLSPPHFICGHATAEKKPSQHDFWPCPRALMKQADEG